MSSRVTDCDPGSPSSAESGEPFRGLILGTAVGDALGLPAEGLSRERIRRRWSGPWRHRFVFGRGMVSDDTEHTFFVAQALLAHPSDPASFQRSLAWKLRLWLLGLPAGVGLATARAILRLWIGIPPHRSGVRSAGNGPAMRSAMLGAFFAENMKNRREFVSASSRLTHTDPRAETAAQAVAEVAAWAARREKEISGLLAALRTLGADPEWPTICTQLAASLEAQKSTQEFANSLGLSGGVTGYAYHSVPVALYAFLRNSNDFRSAIESVLNCGGDTDSTGAITGALAGAAMGAEAIPSEWREGLVEWPRSVRVMENVGQRLAEQRTVRDPLGPVRYFWPAIPLRNALFLTIVLAHGFGRLVPSRRRSNP
jgi:ADP-ribosyl-[dinitrogen reductase] hydrolase